MKYIKLYENIKNEPQIGDYVLIKYSENDVSTQAVELENYIGQITNILKEQKINYPYTVIFKDYGGGDYIFSRQEIIHHSPIKDDLETILSAQKYNL